MARPNRERLMLAIHAKATERYCLSLLTRAIRIAWYEGVIQYMEGSPYTTLGQFLKSRTGKRFRRRCSWVLSR
jgi:hypothetical protein